MIEDITMHNMLPGGLPEDTKVHVLMFYGTSCNPCTNTMPHYEAVSEFYKSKDAPIKFYRIDAWTPEEQKAYCKDAWKVEAVPNFKMFFHGEIIVERSGGGDTPTLHKFVHDGIDEIFKRFSVKI